MQEQDRAAVNQSEAGGAPGFTPSGEAGEEKFEAAAPAQGEEILYDADAEQTFATKWRGRGKTAGYEFPVQITFKPVADGTYIAYDKQRNVRMAGDGAGAVDATNESFGAYVWLGKQAFLRIVGWGPEDGSKLKDDRLAGAVRDALLAAETVARGEALPGDAEELRPWEDDSPGEDPIRLRCLFGSYQLITSHTPRALEDGERDRLLKRYQRLMAHTKIDQGEKFTRRETKVPSRAEALGQLYDEIKFTATGYRGRVPLWHKEPVVHDFFAVEQEVVEKNSQDSGRP